MTAHERQALRDRIDAAVRVRCRFPARVARPVEPRQQTLLVRLRQEPATAAALAAELEIPARTVARDLAALAEHGLAVSTRRGRQRVWTPT
jgi:predicted ArsR family transcriptional regulator